VTRRALFTIAAVILAADRLTKLWIERSVSAWDTLVVIPGFFNIVHTRNRGVAFGLFNDDPASWQQAALIAMSALILGFLARQIWTEGGSTRSRLAFALVMGGAMGNLHDRIFLGAVTDFLEFYAGRFTWPAFNVADSAITVGAVTLALDLWRPRRRPAEA
jgi:signal peptidase II